MCSSDLVASGGGGGGGANFADGAGGNTTGANTGGPMTAAGFFNSTAGQVGANGGSYISTNGTTFVMGGSGGYYPTNVITGYYGYSASEKSGYSQLSPIPLAIPNTTDIGVTKGFGSSFGCGGNGGGIRDTSNGNGGRGGDGLAIIVTW